MDNPRGQVVSVSSPSQRAVVDVDSAPVCPRCASGKGCGAGLFAPKAGGSIEADIAEGLSIRAGDRVELVMAPADLLQAAWVVYGWPLAGALIAAAIASIVGLSEPATVIAALAGLSAGIAASRFRLRREPCLTRYVPIIDKRLDAGPQSL